MSIYTISMERLVGIHAQEIESFDIHGDHNGKCPHCGAFVELPHGDIINELLGNVDGKAFCPYCRRQFDPEPYGIVEYFNDRTPTCDDIIDCLTREYIGTRVHHTMPDSIEDKPHVWTDTAAHRTYCEFRGEVVSIAHRCNVLGDYMAECYHGPHW